jgi:hypothetical protein
VNASNPVAPAATASSRYNNAAFWEGLWRGSGIHFVAFVVVAYFVFGYQPGPSASQGVLVDFFASHRTRIFVASVISGLAVLNLLWFAAALRNALADSGLDGWGAAATAASAAAGALFFLIVAIGASLALASDSTGRESLFETLNVFSWGCFVLSSFPRAMLIMAGTFGLWRARRISNAVFAAGIGVVVLVLLGGTTWASAGVWAPDGEYSRFVSPILGLAWVLAVSRVLARSDTPLRSGW